MLNFPASKIFIFLYFPYLVNQSMFPVTPIWSIGHPPHYHRTLFFAATFPCKNQSMFPVTPIWSIGYPPHTATELCSSLPPSPRSSSDLQLWPPFELIFSRCYSFIPFISNLVDSIPYLVVSSKYPPFARSQREVLRNARISFAMSHARPTDYM
jgi:hypothetical protein